MSLAPDTALGVGQEWRGRALVEREGAGRRQMFGYSVAVGRDADRDRAFSAPTGWYRSCSTPGAVI